jgi:hypothetical protein
MLRYAGRVWAAARITRTRQPGASTSAGTPGTVRRQPTLTHPGRERLRQPKLGQPAATLVVEDLD